MLNNLNLSWVIGKWPIIMEIQRVTTLKYKWDPN